jgi:Cu+-exporting ATPase
MHPEIISDSPGDCPKCGMPLESIRISGGVDAHAEQEIHDLTRRFWLAFAFALPVFLLAMLPMIRGISLDSAIPHSISKYIQLALTTMVVFWMGGSLLVKGLKSLRGWNLNMFTLIGMGVGAAATQFASSVITVLARMMAPRSRRVRASVAS